MPLYFFIGHLLRLALSTSTYKSSQHHPWRKILTKSFNFTFSEDHLDELPEVRAGENDCYWHEGVVGGAEDVLDHDEDEGVGIDWGVELNSDHAHTEEQRLQWSEFS